MSFDRKGKCPICRRWFRSTECPHTWDYVDRVVREVEMMRLIDLLRSEEGDSVTILCDNPDPRTEAENNAVLCNGFWTDFKDRRFQGVGLLDALSAAMIEYKRPREAKKSEGGEPSSEASSHEKRRLDASGELTSTGPETSISPVRTIAQSSASARTANHGVTGGESAATPSDLPERREIVARIIEERAVQIHIREHSHPPDEDNETDKWAMYRIRQELNTFADAILAALGGR